MPITRENLEQQEAQYLAPYAMKSADTEGRKYDESEDPYRLCFQKDKERVVHSKAFRRLDEKTQVFIPGFGDHYRTRLTHTLEVSQISRGIARRLGLNEDLSEVIALAHDLGHPPFGHTGEEALDEMMQEFGLHFEHNQQSRRIVEKLEKTYPHFDGLNLTIEVIEGLTKHQSAWDQADQKFEVAAHLESQSVNLGDEIAYMNHDVDDGLRGGLITLDQLEDFEIWKVARQRVFEEFEDELERDILVPRTVSEMIFMMIDDLCMRTEENIDRLKIQSVGDVRNCKEMIACFSDEMETWLKALGAFLYEKFYMNPEVLKSVLEGKEMIKQLFRFYMENPDKLPKDFVYDEKWEIVVKDYIAGMTDRFLTREYRRFFV